MRLVCIPNAGGNAAQYSSWQPLLGSRIECCPARLPGREGRLREAPYDELHDLVSDLGSWLANRADVPLALFGHSLGGVIAFELARLLRRSGAKVIYLIAAACSAPHCPRRQAALHGLPDAEFLEKMRSRYGGIPEAVAEDAEWMALMLPTLRADVKMLETYRYREEEPLDCPILALGGTEDKTVLLSDLAAWRDQTTASFSQRTFPGDHFFVSRSQRAVVRLIRQRISASGL